MNDTLAATEITCPKCGTNQAASETCIKCGLIFAKYRPPVSNLAVSTLSLDADKTRIVETIAATAANHVDTGSDGKVDPVTIIAVLMLIDAALSLLGKTTTAGGVLGSAAGFHQKAKFLYDLLTSAGMLASAIGVLRRKEWARVSMTALLALGMAEGLYMLAYMHVTVSGLEKDLGSDFSDLKRNLTVKWIGCALYAYFIITLNSAKVKARFRL